MWEDVIFLFFFWIKVYNCWIRIFGCIGIFLFFFGLEGGLFVVGLVLGFVLGMFLFVFGIYIENYVS